MNIVKWTLEQEEDCCGRTSEVTQQLEIELQDGGGGHYAVISTKRFAVEPKNLRALAKEIEKRIKVADLLSETAIKRIT